MYDWQIEERDMEQIGQRYGALFKFQIGQTFLKDILRCDTCQSFTCQGIHFWHSFLAMDYVKDILCDTKAQQLFR